MTSMTANMTMAFKNASSGHTSEYMWPSLLAIFAVLGGVTGNVLVCVAVWAEKKLQTVTNYFLMSLSVADLLVCTVVMPFSIINDFIGEPLVVVIIIFVTL